MRHQAAWSRRASGVILMARPSMCAERQALFRRPDDGSNSCQWAPRKCVSPVKTRVQTGLRSSYSSFEAEAFNLQPQTAQTIDPMIQMTSITNAILYLYSYRITCSTEIEKRTETKTKRRCETTFRKIVKNATGFRGFIKP